MRSVRQSRNRGFVLILVLCLVLAMTGLVLAFHRRARIGLRTADALQKSAQALSCARAGLAVGKNLVLATEPNDAPAAGTLTLVDLGTGSCRVELSDEQGKINLNLLIDADGRPDRARIDQVLRLIDLINRDGGTTLGYGIVPAIIDWIDSDDQTICLDFIQRQNTGAESGFYQGLELPYSCTNKPLETPEELLLVKGISPEIYDRLSPYVTVYGDGLIHLNAATDRVIESLSEEMDQALARRIVERRRIQPFQDLEEVRQVPGMTDSIHQRIQRLVTIGPGVDCWKLQATGQVDNLSRTLSAILQKNAGTGTVDIVSYREDRSKK